MPDTYQPRHSLSLYLARVKKVQGQYYLRLTKNMLLFLSVIKEQGGLLGRRVCGGGATASTTTSLRSHVLFFVVLLLFLLSSNNSNAQRIAIIGGGISGTFCSKYLIDHVGSSASSSNGCSLLDSITIFDPEPIGRIIQQDDESKDDNEQNSDQPYYQGSRIAPLQLKSNSGNQITIELGASIGYYKGFKYVLEMAKSGNLEVGKPFTTGNNKSGTDSSNDDGSEDGERKVRKKRNGMAIYNGNKEFVLNTAPLPKPWFFGYYNWTSALEIGWRYNFDAIKMNSITDTMVDSFLKIHDLIDDNDIEKIDVTALESPQSLWDTVGLLGYVNTTLNDICDTIGLTNTVQDWKYWFKSLLFGSQSQGILRTELLDSINLVNYNQPIDKVNGISGIGSFAASKGGTESLFSIVGGNSKLIQSAYEQSYDNYKSKCHGNSNDNKDVITHERIRIDTVVSKGIGGFDLYGKSRDGNNSTSSSSSIFVGTYDIVILAVPISMCNIEFLITSPIDTSVLQPMPLGGLIDAHGSEDDGGYNEFRTQYDHDGHPVLPKPLPDLVTRPYTQVVTTIVSNANLQLDYFGLSTSSNEDGTDGDGIPRGIYMTSKGKELTNNITAIAQIGYVDDQIYKIFSNDKLSLDMLQTYFGESVSIEYVKVWGGQYGGATPNYLGQGITTNFLLYDGTTGHSTPKGTGGLYYPNSMETTFAW